MVLEACANSSGLDFGMPVDLWRSGKTTVERSGYAAEEESGR